MLFVKQGDNQGSIDGNFRRRPDPHGHTRSDIIARYFPLPLSCGTMQVALPVASLPARSRAVTVR